MSVPLPTSPSRSSKSGQLWAVHWKDPAIHGQEQPDETNKEAEVLPTKPSSLEALATTEPQDNLTTYSTVLHCCKDDELRQGQCCRELKPSDERTLISPNVIRDIIIGLSDGLTVPFALTAGLSSLGSSHFVVLAGVAELISGAISMGVGGYFSAQAEKEHYQYKARQIRQRVKQSCAKELTDEIVDILEPYGATYAVASSLSERLWKAEKEGDDIVADRIAHSSSPLKFPSFRRSGSETMPTTENEKRGLTQFLVQVGEGLEPMPASRVYTSAITIGISYLAGGLVPLLPYIFIKHVHTALFVSIGITTGLLLAFGVIKQRFSGARTGIMGYTYGAISTLLVGGVAAGASYGIVYAIEGHYSAPS